MGATQKFMCGANVITPVIIALALLSALYRPPPPTLSVIELTADWLSVRVYVCICVCVRI